MEQFNLARFTLVQLLLILCVFGHKNLVIIYRTNYSHVLCLCILCSCFIMTNLRHTPRLFIISKSTFFCSLSQNQFLTIKLTPHRQIFWVIERLMFIKFFQATFVWLFLLTVSFFSCIVLLFCFVFSIRYFPPLFVFRGFLCCAL